MVEKGYIGRSIQIIATNPFEYLIAGLLLGGLVVGSGGLLVGPAAGGVIAMTLKRCRGEEIDVYDAFRGFENFPTTFPVGLAFVGMVLLGSIFALLPGWILAALFCFSLPVAIDRPVGPGEALRLGRTLGSRDLLAHLIFIAILAAVAFSGAIFLLVGLCLTVPIAIAALTIAYHDAAYPPHTAPGASDL